MAAQRSPDGEGCEQPEFDGPGPGTVGPVDAFQRRHSVIGFPIAVIYKFIDDFGGYLCALMTYYGFLSLFPVLLLLSTALSIILDGYPSWQEAILDSALSDFPIVGDELRETGSIGGGGPLSIILSGLAALYGGLGIGQAVQYAMNTAWMVPRNSRPNPFASRARGLLLLLVAGLTVTVTTAVTTYLQQLFEGDLVWVATTVASVAISTFVIGTVFVIATSRPLDPTDVLPGALLAAIGWQIMQNVGTTYVGTVVARASNLNSVFAIVLGLLVFIYTIAVIGMICIEINVVRKERLWPRALLTPFTDSVVLTEADQRAYSRHAMAQRLKGFQQIDVFFHDMRGDDDGLTEDDSAHRPPTG